jgi:hypothetical protein
MYWIKRDMGLITLSDIYIGSPMVCDVIWFISNEFCVFYSWALGDSFYHIFTTNISILYTLFFGLRGVGIHNVISKNYHMSDITLISRKICDKYRCLMTTQFVLKQGKKILIFEWLTFCKETSAKIANGPLNSKTGGHFQKLRVNKGPHVSKLEGHF